MFGNKIVSLLLSTTATTITTTTTATPTTFDFCLTSQFFMGYSASEIIIGQRKRLCIVKSKFGLSTLSLYHNCDSTTIRLQYDDTTTHSTMTEVIEITVCIRFDCDTTTTRLRRKTDMFILLASNGSRRARDTS